MSIDTLIPRLPDGWTIVPFGSVLDGNTRNGIYKSKEFHGRGAKVVNMGELFAYKRLFPVEMKRVELTEKERSSFLLNPGDLLFARRSLVAEGAGRCSVVCEIDEPTTFESSIIRARPQKSIAHGMFLFYLFSSPIGRHLIGTLLRQTSVSGITGTDLVKLGIPLPPVDEQIAIAKLLGALDDKIELNRQMNHTLEAIGHALFKSWFVHFDPVTAKAAGRAPFGMDAETAALFPSTFEESELGTIPTGWHVSTIGQAATVVGGSTPSTKNGEYWEGGSNFWATPRDLSKLLSPVLIDTERKITGKGLKQISSGQLPIGTVLLSSRAPVGYLAIAEVPVSINQGFIAMKCNGTLNSHYVLQWTRENMDEVLSRAGGTTFAEISKSNFRPIPVLIPTEPILERFNELASNLHERLLNNLRESDTLAALRDLLLPKLMSGEVRLGQAEKILAEAV